MLRFFGALLVALAMCIPAMGETGALEPGFLGVGFDEGLIARCQLTQRISAYVGLGYYVKGPDTTYRQPINNINWKLGGEFTIKQFDKLKVNSFFEWREEINQKETPFAAGGNTIRFNQFNTIFRAGIRPEYFIHENISIDYKIGIQMIIHGEDYKLNATSDGLVGRDNGYSEFGVYHGRFVNEESLLLNLGLTIYLGRIF
jgi:hypothetical protein